jgi:hypothetical protein
LFCCYVVRADEEEVEPEARGAVHTSTSNTLVLSEEPHVAPEASPPARDNPETSIPVRSPQAPEKKKAKIGAAGEQELATGSTSTPVLDDVSYLFLLVAFFS